MAARRGTKSTPAERNVCSTPTGVGRTGDGVSAAETGFVELTDEAVALVGVVAINWSAEDEARSRSTSAASDKGNGSAAPDDKRSNPVSSVNKGGNVV